MFYYTLDKPYFCIKLYMLKEKENIPDTRSYGA